MAKPKKNRFWCIESKQFKQQFESEEKAVRFIEWNKDAFSKKYRPVRAYFCEACGCWHLTHLVKPRRDSSLTEEVIERMKKEEEGILNSIEGGTQVTPNTQLRKLREELDCVLFEGDGEISKEQLDSIWTKYTEIKKDISDDSSHIKYMDLFFYQKGYIAELPVKEKRKDILYRIRYNLLHGVYNQKDASDFIRLKEENPDTKLLKEVEALYKAAIEEKAI